MEVFGGSLRGVNSRQYASHVKNNSARLSVKQPKCGGSLQDGHSPASPRSALTEAASVSTIPAEAVREELQRILNSHEFRTSRRSQDFLRYVVESTLAGSSDSLKERIIGIEVFGRPSSYEPGEDATVRVKASEVRKRLGLYYSANLTDPIVIDLPLGTYVPEFHTAADSRKARQNVESPGVAQPPAKSRLWIWAAAAALALVAGGVFVNDWSHRRKGGTSTAFEEFWEPVLGEPRPVSLCAVTVPVYSQMREPGPGEKISAEDFRLVPDQFVAVGDLSSLLQLSDMFGRLSHPYRMRIGKDVSFLDIRSSPAVMVGFSYTKWDEISKGFRYFIDMSRRPIGILDNGQPTTWILSTHPDDPDLHEDYAVISRVFDADTHNILFQISGISHFGTEAGTDFVTNPALLTEAFRNAPSGWEKKNVQIVLHVNVINGTPGVASVLATHFW